MIARGRKIPDARLGLLMDGELRSVSLRDRLAEKYCVVLGMPGAFTPVCTKKHLPNIIAKRDAIFSSGIQKIICITANDPWVIDVWKQSFSETEGIEFLSDGNRDFMRKAKMVEDNCTFFLGHTSKRYAIFTRDVIVARFAVEDTVLQISQTSGDSIVCASQALGDETRDASAA